MHFKRISTFRQIGAESRLLLFALIKPIFDIHHLILSIILFQNLCGCRYTRIALFTTIHQMVTNQYQVIKVSFPKNKKEEEETKFQTVLCSTLTFRSIY